MPTMNAVFFDRTGEPAEVLRVGEAPLPEPGPGEVRVRMIASPINPSDLMTIRGNYVAKPALPATPGYEGVGVVDRAGPGVLGRFMVGRRVAVLNQAGGNWAEYATVPANRVIPVAADLPDDQVASFFVNPATVLAMVRHVLRVPKGGWLLQTAAGSALGKMVIKLGRHDGFKTLNVVRRPEAAEALRQLGADEVIVSTEGPIDEQVRRVVGPEGISFAIDPVGGDTGTAVFDALATGGRMLSYGTLAGEPTRLNTRMLIAGKRIEGFYLGRFMQDRSLPKSLLLFREVAGLIRAGVLATDPGLSFPIASIGEAVVASEAPGHGKVLLRLGPA